METKGLAEKAENGGAAWRGLNPYRPQIKLQPRLGDHSQYLGTRSSRSPTSHPLTLQAQSAARKPVGSCGSAHSDSTVYSTQIFGSTEFEFQNFLHIK